MGINAKTGFGGNLIDAQVNGVSKFKVDNSGSVIASNTLTAPQLGTTGNTGYLQFGTNHYIQGSATEALLFDSTGHSPRVQLGGTTSSFPAIKRSAAILQARLADDSAYATWEGKFKTVATAESTGAGSALLGSNSPAATLTAPYTWETVISSDGSTCYRPLWK